MQKTTILLFAAVLVVGLAGGFLGGYLAGMITKAEVQAQLAVLAQAPGNDSNPAAPATELLTADEDASALDSLFVNARVNACLKERLGEARFAAVQADSELMTTQERFKVLPCYNEGYVANYFGL